MSQQTQAVVQTQQKTKEPIPARGSILQRAAVIPAITPVHSGIVQRCSGGVECEECRQRRLEREGMLQRAAVNAMPVSEGANGVPPIVHDVLNSPGQPLDVGTRAFMEPRFGYDFSRVRVHTDARAAESARAVNALAYTVGRDVVFGEGQYEAGTSEGRRLMAHELTHVVQQEGVLGSRVQGKLTINQPDDVYEREAELMARQGLEMDATDQTRDDANGPLTNNAVVATPLSRGALLLQRTCAQNASEAFYRAAPNYCKDTGFTGALHPGQTCYREVPKRSSYFECPPGDQVCFDDKSVCHDSYDEASPVEMKNPDGTCNLHGICSIAHGFKDVIPSLLEESGRRQLECIQSCEKLPWYSKGFCLQGCSGGGPSF